MKSLKIFFLATVAIVAGLFTACSDDKFEGGPDVDGAQVYFPENISTTFSISDDVSSITIPVKRIKTDEALTVTLLPNDESGLFNIPTSVTFAAGKETADLLITFNRTQLQDGTEYPLAIIINDESNITPYGNRTINLTVAPWPWELLGTGKFRDGWLSDVFTDTNVLEIEVQIHKHKSKAGIYMVENMFGWPYLTELFGATKEALSKQFSYTPTNILIDCSNTASVKVAKQWSGITENSNGYGNFMFYSVAAGKLENGIITFPNKGLGADLVGAEMSFYTNTNDTFRILFPGVEATDYSLSAEYAGMKVSADNTKTSAVVDFSYGNDVTGISYVFAAGDVTATADKIAADIVAGKIENVYEVKNFVKGSKQTSIETEFEKSGLFTIISLPKDKTGVLLAKEASAVSFYFPGMSGGGAPACDIAVMMGLVSENWPEASAQNPDISSIYFEITGSELKTMSTWLTPTTNLNLLLAEGATEEELVDLFGTDRSKTFMPKVNSEGGYGSAWINLPDGTSMTMLVKATNTYGEKAVVKATFSTTSIPYTGELVLGEYYMSYKEDSGYSCENVFNVRPTAGSSTAFFVSCLGYSGSTLQWYATYNPAAGTLTLDGKAKGYESNGNIFGRITSAYDGAGVYVYSWWSYLDPNGAATNDPFVIKVNAAKKPSELSTTLHCPLLQNSDKKKVGDLSFFPIGTKITPYTQGQTSAAIAKAQSFGKNNRFSSVEVPAISKSQFGNSIFTTDAYFGKNYSSNVVRTLNVKTAQCEPLPKEAGRVAKLKVNNSTPIVK